MTAAITVRDLHKRYGDTRAVDGVDLDVEQGQVVCLLGPNGAGKTTTIEILEGHRPRDSGEVSVLGTDPAHASEKFRTRIGIVAQSQAGTFAELTVREIVGHFATFYPNARRADEAIALVGLTEKAGARLRQLSGGQRRRIDVALGVIGRPELLFLDEPTTGFDPEARRQFWGLIHRLSEEGTTVLLTTHYLEEAEALADRVAVIARGSVVAEGLPSSLGGRNEAEAIVRWRDDGVLRELRSATPTKAVADLGARLGGEVPELTVTRPTLEDVYLRLIGADDVDED